MKKFKFSLASVLAFKEQILENKKLELAAAVQAVAEQEGIIRRLERECMVVIGEFNQKKLDGMTVIDAQSYEIHITILHKNIDSENENLLRLREEEAKKQADVIEAKQEVSSLEKLKEHKLEEHDKAAMKEEELFIDEMVSNKRVVAAIDAGRAS